jgi:hypothetical protein
MAKFVSQVYSEIRGSVNGVTYARNRFGLYARAKASPVQPRTPAQTERRAQLTLLSQRWRTLTEGNRAEWRAFADELIRSDTLGQTYRLTGLQAYLQFNLWRLLLGLTVQDNAPTQFQAPSPIKITDLLYDATNDELELEFSPTPYSGALGIWATAPFSRGINFVAPSRYRLISVRKPGTFGGAITSPQGLRDDYIAKFGITPGELLGKRIAVAITPVSYVSATTAGVAGQRATLVRDIGAT